MKRSAALLTYYYHVVKTDGGYKVKRSLFAKIEGGLFCASTKQMAENQVLLIIQSKVNTIN
jgi:hypothetical protein